MNERAKVIYRPGSDKGHSGRRYLPPMSRTSMNAVGAAPHNTLIPHSELWPRQQLQAQLRPQPTKRSSLQGPTIILPLAMAKSRTGRLKGRRCPAKT